MIEKSKNIFIFFFKFMVSLILFILPFALRLKAFALRPYFQAIASITDVHITDVNPS